MPNQPKTKARNIRIPDEVWEQAGELTAAEGTDRTAIVVAALRRYIKRRTP